MGKISLVHINSNYTFMQYEQRSQMIVISSIPKDICIYNR